MNDDWKSTYDNGMNEAKNKNYHLAITFWLESIEKSQDHAEPFYQIAAHYLAMNIFTLAEAFTTAGKKIKKPTDGYVDENIYDWRFDDIETVILSYINPTKENLLGCTITTNEILKKYKTRMKKTDIERIEKNHNLFKKATELKQGDMILYAIARYSELDDKKRQYMKNIKEIWGNDIFE